MYRYKQAAEIVPGNTYALLEQQADRLVSKPANGFTLADDNDEINLNFVFLQTETPDVYKLKDTKSGKLLTNTFGSLRLNAEATVKSGNSSDKQTDSIAYKACRTRSSSLFRAIILSRELLYTSRKTENLTISEFTSIQTNIHTGHLKLFDKNT